MSDDTIELYWEKFIEECRSKVIPTAPNDPNKINASKAKRKARPKS